ncbi:MAG: YvrJ family protein [Firmicutes bacterium]|nr:YvrJ family protein [Bacillota bacterium]
MQEIFEVLSNQAFPIVISIYLLTRFESKMDALRIGIEALTNEIRLLVNERKNENN